MKITRVWAMPNKKTFRVKPINDLIHEVIQAERPTVIVDPFANDEPLATITNDLDPQYATDYHLDALDFLKQLPTASADLVFYDPPYSPRQVAESYRQFGMSVNMETTQSSYWRKQKEQISRITKRGWLLPAVGTPAA